MSADDLARQMCRKFADTDLVSVTEDGAFTGYASLFDAVDLGRESVAPGAFAKSLAAKKAGGIRMLFQHNPDEPIGRWDEIIEDGRGLRVRGQIALDVARGREVLALMRAGALDGLSIGFKSVRAKVNPATGIRHILEADLWEVSVVTFPMLPQARVDAVKSRRRPSVREFERHLVRDAGLTRSEARIAIAKGYAHLPARDAQSGLLSGGGTVELKEIIRRASGMIETN